MLLMGRWKDSKKIMKKFQTLLGKSFLGCIRKKYKKYLSNWAQNEINGLVITLFLHFVQFFKVLSSTNSNTY